MTSAGALDHTWVDCLVAYKAEVDAMRLWDTVCVEGLDAEQLLSSPEVLDPKTDTGYEWKNHGTASGYFASSSLTNVSKLSEAQMLDIVDALFAKEVLFLRGRHLLQGLYQFVYFLRMHELKEKSPVLYAYCRGLLRTVDFVARTANMTTVRDDEEFPSLPAEIDTQSDCPLAQIVQELNDALAVVTNETLKQRLVFRKQLLQLFFEVFTAEQNRSIGGVVSACNSGINMLASMKRETPLYVEPGLFRTEMSTWLSSDIPIKTAPLPEFDETVLAYRTMFEQIACIRPLFSAGGRTLSAVTEFAEALGAKKPLLTTRSIAVLLLFGENVNVSFLHQGSLPMLILETLANLHGAPLYGKVAEGDEAVLKELAFFCGHRGQKSLVFGRDVAEAMHRWVARAARMYLAFWEGLLCSRGRTHRRLTNLIEELGSMQLMSLDIDTNAFEARRTGLSNVAPQADREMIGRSLMLTSFIVELTCQVMGVVLHLMVELQLLSKAEYLPWAVYCSHVHSARLENLAALYLGLNNSRTPIPERRLNRAGIPMVNPCLTMRFATTPSPVLLTRLDGNGVLADVVFRAAVVLQAQGHLSLSEPATSLVPVSQTFHNRMKAFARVQRPGFMTFGHCEEQQTLFLAAFNKNAAEKATNPESPNGAPIELTGIANIAKQVADRTKQVAAQVLKDVPLSSVGLGELEKAARATYVSLNLLNTLQPEALKSFELSLAAPTGAPGHLAIVMKRK